MEYIKKIEVFKFNRIVLLFVCELGGHIKQSLNIQNRPFTLKKDFL